MQAQPLLEAPDVDSTLSISPLYSIERPNGMKEEDRQEMTAQGGGGTDYQVTS